VHSTDASAERRSHHADDPPDQGRTTNVADMTSETRTRTQNLTVNEVAAEVENPDVVLVDIPEPNEVAADKPRSTAISRAARSRRSRCLRPRAVSDDSQAVS